MYTATLGTSTGFATAAAAAVHLVDDDIALFTTSVLRSQLEIDLMLKQQRNENFALATINFKKKRSCFRKWHGFSFLLITASNRKKNKDYLLTIILY